MFELKNISLSYGKRVILNDINLKANRGKIVVLTGKSGSGKSTLLGIISGLLKPKAGKVYYNGKDISHWGDWRKSRFRNRKIGFVFQFFNLNEELNAYDNIVYPTSLNIHSKDVKRRANELIDLLDIKQILGQYPATLSGGERQRVAIARAIINNPEFLLADEPTGNLDQETADDIFALFQELRDKYNMSIIMITHNPRFISQADEHYHLENAKLIRTYSKTEKLTAKEKASQTTIKKNEKKKVTKKTQKKTVKKVTKKVVKKTTKKATK